MSALTINGKTYTIDVSPDVPLLWIIREHLRLTGTKYGCGIGQCGSCTVHIDGKAERSCQLTAGDIKGRKITTIEGIPDDHPLKKAWIDHQVPQCGYCQPGKIMQASAFLSEHKNPSEDDIVRAMDGHLCRCGTYPRIIRAIKSAAAKEKKP